MSDPSGNVYCSNAIYDYEANVFCNISKRHSKCTGLVDNCTLPKSCTDNGFNCKKCPSKLICLTQRQVNRLTKNGQKE